MLYGLYMSAGGLQMQEYRQSVLANNLANAQTVGFKRDLAMAQARLNPAAEIPELAGYRQGIRGQQGGGVWALPTGIDLSQGSLQKTDSDFDVAIDGAGFFMVQGANPSEEALTRDGRFLINDQGLLAMAATGRPVLGADGKPIKLERNQNIIISTRGEIEQNGTVVGQLAVMNVKNAGDLQKLGSNLLAVREGSSMQPATVATQIRQGYIEESGVDPMTEMVQMLEGQRAFEANAKMIQYQDQMLGMLNGVGKIA